MQLPWRNNEIYTLRHSATPGDMLWSMVPHCHKSRWVSHDEKKRKGKKGRYTCTRTQRDETAWTYEKMHLKHRVKNGKSLRRRLGLRQETWNPMTCYHLHAATQGEASFSPLLSLLLREASRTGWRDGNEPRVINQAMRDKTSIEKESWVK